ncbi:hypothetical protein SDC9_194032 [bioreactor metagenome]|uniref:Uncharacterized protein n=1 Tax=bioreactor metagenome TaxID=1076179 RepID=A0A645I6C6_9ZZZZ
MAPICYTGICPCGTPVKSAGIASKYSLAIAESRAVCGIAYGYYLSPCLCEITVGKNSKCIRRIAGSGNKRAGIDDEIIS